MCTANTFVSELLFFFFVAQNASRGRGVPTRAEEGSVPAGQGSRSEGGRKSAGLRLESAKERKSKTQRKRLNACRSIALKALTETRCFTNLPFKCFPGQRSVRE